MINIIYSFEDSADYNFDPSDIVVSDGLANLKEPYSIDNPDITTWDAERITGLGYLTDFSADTLIPAGTAVKFVIQVDDVMYFHDGTEWSESTGYAESNTAEQIAEYLPDFIINNDSDIRIIAYLHSSSGIATPVLSEISFGYIQESYVGLSYINRYCAKMGYTAWDSITDTAKREAILRAMNYIESRCFKGIKYSEDQDLQFPRSGVIYQGYELAIDMIPDKLKRAVAEAAYLESQTAGVLQPSCIS